MFGGLIDDTMKLHPNPRMFTAKLPIIKTLGIDNYDEIDKINEELKEKVHEISQQNILLNFQQGQIFDTSEELQRQKEEIQSINDSLEERVAERTKVLECEGIYMANYFLPSGEKFEYGMKEKSISTTKVLKTYALEIGIPEKEWDEGVNKAVDKHYGSKYDKTKTEKCHSFVEALVPNGAERVKKVVQTLY